jgi:hypothetical protein
MDVSSSSTIPAFRLRLRPQICLSTVRFPYNEISPTHVDDGLLPKLHKEECAFISIWIDRAYFHVTFISLCRENNSNFRLRASWLWYHVHFTLKMEGVISSETLVPTYHNIRCLFVSGLFKDVSISDCIALNDVMIGKGWFEKVTWREAVLQVRRGTEGNYKHSRHKAMSWPRLEL